MFISLNWLKDFVKIPDSLAPEDLAKKFSLHTVEVESIVRQSEKFSKVIVGKILEIKKHPQADRLQLVKVDVGSEKLDIVCGAHNIKAGDLVPVALVGAVLPNGMEIKEAEIRGEKSSGMLCAEDELGLGRDHSGIFLLDGAKVGKNLGEHLGQSDIIFDVDNKSITNRPDLWGHFGMAREVAAFLGTKLKAVDYDLKKYTKPAKKVEIKKLKVEIKEEKLCPRYMAIAVNQIEVKDSPEWIKNRLIAVGMRPINNIVDLTNYVMLELGQPLHAFDASLVKEICVRQAKEKEEIETLDGEKRILAKDMLVIADGEKPLAVAGVMGGVNSEISAETNSIIIEAANFEPTQVRKTAHRLGLRTESSMRFEKSLDPNLCEKAMARILALAKEVCPKSEVASYLVDEKSFKAKENRLEIDLVWLEKIIGEKIEKRKIFNILSDLGFGVKELPEKLEVTIPTWRAMKDVSHQEDVAEEIVRIYGYDNLKAIMPAVTMDAPKNNKEIDLERRIKNILAQEAKLVEVYNYSFVSQDQLKKLKLENKNYIKLVNPIVSGQDLLRQELVPNILENIKLNQARYNEIGLFEIGNVFSDLPGEIKKDNKSEEKLPFQEKRLGVVIAGGNNEDCFRQLKGVLEYLLKSFNLEAEFEVKAEALPWAKADEAAELVVEAGGKYNLGFLAILSKSVASSFGIKKAVAIAEINLRELIELIRRSPEKKYQRTPKYPSAVRDLAFVVEDKILYNKIKEEIEKFSSLIKEVELFDVYQGEELGKDKKSLAFHLVYQSLEKTLTAEEVNEEQERLVKFLEKKFSAQIRNF